MNHFECLLELQCVCVQVHAHTHCVIVAVVTDVFQHHYDQHLHSEPNKITQTGLTVLTLGEK